MTGPNDQQPQEIDIAQLAHEVVALRRLVLSILVSEKGSVDQVQVLESSPSGVFDAAALQGIRSWQFEPAKYQGDVVRVWAKQRIRFDLS